jgi:hypothetical protein
MSISALTCDTHPPLDPDVAVLLTAEVLVIAPMNLLGHPRGGPRVLSKSFLYKPHLSLCVVTDSLTHWPWLARDGMAWRAPSV